MTEEDFLRLESDYVKAMNLRRNINRLTQLLQCMTECMLNGRYKISVYIPLDTEDSVNLPMNRDDIEGTEQRLFESVFKYVESELALCLQELKEM